METYRWVTGLTIAVVFGGLVTQYYASKIKILVGEDNPEYRISIPISIGFVESLFFTIGVAFICLELWLPWWPGWVRK